ncbi:hypothetical protein Cgig2_010656 [Carnegiea gigantea]|uniref:CCHC-type domain-containing protein n=1 Tax=Carnegiea gigantea TaxID=171969 RepID=A0A9Q1JGU9_9CARY|nr:hypothetical protein Cgig2_010656 [Carnegiea gigantea]
MVCSERGRSQFKRRGGPRERSQYRSKDMSNIECYYCGEKGHVQNRCPNLKEDLVNLKKLQEKMRGKAKLEDEDESDANVIDGGDVFLTKSALESVNDSIEGQNSWVLDSAASMHICKDKNSFDTLHSHGNYGFITVGNRLILPGEKDKKNICCLIGCSVLGTTNDSKSVEFYAFKYEVTLCHHFVHPNMISLFSLDVQALLHLKEPTVLLRCREMDRKVVESALEDSKREYAEKARVAAPQLP